MIFKSDTFLNIDLPNMRSIGRQLSAVVSAYTLVILIGKKTRILYNDRYIIFHCNIMHTYGLLKSKNKGGSTCLKIVGFDVPSVADLRRPARLSCTYNTDQDVIFSVKWYKDDQEFYRFMPNHKVNT